MDIKAVKILVEYDDGSFDHAEGPNAEKIWSWLMSCQTLALVHGAKYRGPRFRHDKEKENT